RLAKCAFQKTDHVVDAVHVPLATGTAAGCVAGCVRRNRNAAAIEHIAHANRAGITKNQTVGIELDLAADQLARHFDWFVYLRKGVPCVVELWSGGHWAVCGLWICEC